MGREKDHKNAIIIFLLVIVLVMSVGFALLGSNLEVIATGTIAGEWGVHFKNETIEPISKTDGVSGVTSQLDTNALKLTLNASFEKPGDSLTYELKIENTGTINAFLKSVEVTGQDGNTEAIKLSYNVKSNNKATTYAEGSIIGKTAQQITTPSPATASLNKKTISGENSVIENNYLTVTLEYLENTTTAGTEESATYTLSLQYEQTDAN